MVLKTDLHLHTREGEGFIAYDARGLIDRAAREGFQVLSITNHDALTFSEHLAAYARERGILLIPGLEATIDGRHWEWRLPDSETRIGVGQWGALRGAVG